VLRCRPTGGSRHSGVLRRPSRACAALAGPAIDIWRVIEVTTCAGAQPDLQLVINVIGDVDADTASTMFVELTRALDAVPAVCCDLSATSFFGADGANVLAVVHLHAAKVRSSFSVRGVHGMVARVLDATGLTEILHVAT
jgi:anti-anti-sigma factor